MLPLEQLHSLLGEQTLRDLVAAFYQRVRHDDLIGPMYPPEDWQGAQERLADFLIYRLGGSQAYLEKRGHPRLRMRHMPFAIGQAEAQRWVQLMDEAMAQCALPTEAALTLRAFFVQVAQSMRNQVA